MLKINAAYLYEFGKVLHEALSVNEEDMNALDFYVKFLRFRDSVQGFVFGSIYSSGFKALQVSARDMLAKFDDVMPANGEGTDWRASVEGWRISSILESIRGFESVLNAELQSALLYYVSPKGGYDTRCLTEEGALIFPIDLPQKVPTAMPDIAAACRCIAFELPTAAGFHLHRANESVLRVYWDCVTNGADRPKQGNIGVYLSELSKLNAGKTAVIEHLKSIKDFHRNPLMHPEQTLDTIDSAIDLLAAIRCSIGYMLSDIPLPQLPQAVSDLPPK